MKYLECRYVDNDCLISRSSIDDDLYDEFIKDQSKTNPTVKWVEMEFVGKNKYFIHNYKSEVKFTIDKQITGKFVRIKRYTY